MDKCESECTQCAEKDEQLKTAEGLINNLVTGIEESRLALMILNAKVKEQERLIIKMNTRIVQTINNNKR